MLSITRLPALSIPKIQQKLTFLLKNGVVERHINKQCQNDIVKLCRSFSVLHNLTNKSKNPVSIQRWPRLSFKRYRRRIVSDVETS